MATINISLPASMYSDVKKYASARRYTSISELMRDAVRKLLYPELTENGFTPEFEEMVLRAEAEPQDKNRVWNSLEDIDAYFDDLRKQLKKHAENQKNRDVRSKS